jgi:hypothetical protein
MAAPKTLRVTARPSKREGAFWSTSFWLFGDNPDTHVTEFTVTAPAELKTAMTEWAMALSLPEGMDGWSLSIAKTSARWPSGFKALADKTNIVVPVKEAA